MIRLIYQPRHLEADELTGPLVSTVCLLLFCLRGKDNFIKEKNKKQPRVGSSLEEGDGDKG